MRRPCKRCQKEFEPEETATGVSRGELCPKCRSAARSVSGAKAGTAAARRFNAHAAMLPGTRKVGS